MAFDPSVIGGIGEAATGPVSQAPMRALQLSDLTQQGQMQQLAIKDKKDEQADLEYAKAYIGKNKLNLSDPDDQARMVSAMASRSPKMAMSMQRDFAESDMSQVKLKEADLAYHAARMDTISLPAEHIVETMEDMAKQGKGAQEIQAYGVNAATELLKNLQGKSIGARPVLTKEDTTRALEMLQKPDIYQSLKGFVGESQKAREAYSQYTKNLHEQATTEAAGEKVETVMKGGKPHRVMFDAKGNVKKDLGEAPPSAAMINLQAGKDAGKPDASVAAQIATGMPINQIIPGYGNSARAERKAGRLGAIKQIMAETGLDEAGAGKELAKRSIEFSAGKTSVTALNKMEGFTRSALKQLDFNVDKANEFMDKVSAQTDLSPVLNAIINKQQAWTGNPNMAPLFMYMNAVAIETARLQSGGQASTAQLHQGAAEETKKWLEAGAITPASWKKLAPEIKAEGENRLKNFQDAKEAMMPGGEETPDPASQTPVPASPSGAAGAGSGPAPLDWTKLKKH